MCILTCWSIFICHFPSSNFVGVKAHCEKVCSLIAFFSVHVLSRVRIYICEVYHVNVFVCSLLFLVTV